MLAGEAAPQTTRPRTKDQGLFGNAAVQETSRPSSRYDRIVRKNKSQGLIAEKLGLYLARLLPTHTLTE